MLIALTVSGVPLSMTIKHVVLDIYNLVQVRNPRLVPALIQTLAESTRYPWEECAYAFAESTNYFRALESDGAFVCDPRDFVEDLMVRLDQSTYSHQELMIDFITTSLLYQPHVTPESKRAVKYLASKAITTAFVGNVNMIPSSVIAMQLQVHFSPRDVDFNLLEVYTQHQMPHDAVWLHAIEHARRNDKSINASEILFVTTNPKYAKVAERTGMQIAVIGSVEELSPALHRRIEHTLDSEGSDYAILG